MFYFPETKKSIYEQYGLVSASASSQSAPSLSSLHQQSLKAEKYTVRTSYCNYVRQGSVIRSASIRFSNQACFDPFRYYPRGYEMLTNGKQTSVW